jgi:hypothetical protein
MRAICALAFSTIALSACTVDVTPPVAQGNSADWQAHLDHPFEKVWAATIDHATQTFFVIDNIEKDSGIITLSFGSADEAQFIDCGSVKSNKPNIPNGPVTDAFKVGASTSLEGKMNVRVKPEENGGTAVTVRARYIYQVVGPGYSQTWGFDTNGSAVRPAATGDAITCRPTHYAERTVIEGIKDRLE